MIDDKGYPDASVRAVCEGSPQHFDDSQQGQDVDQYFPKGHFHIDRQEKPQVEKRFYDAACQTKEDRQGKQAQDDSHARVPDTCDVIGHERDHESLGPAVRESLF
ncbi:MAG TPA: hypothetical protein VGQ79_02940 [Nitrospiraceae bacterium]|jgi:hypothetical protein|nr:hypothetical protein [Nitrospiraceae bacterium]